MLKVSRRGISISVALGLIAPAWHSAFAATGPCDIYLAAGTPCVAAHSTVRALYGAYNGPLYQVKRTSDNATQDIMPIAPGGPANGNAQDKFCTSACVVTEVYDQSGKGNYLESQAYGPTVAGNDDPTAASTENFMLNGQKVYSLYIKPKNSFWRDGHATGMPLKAEPEGTYMVTSGKHFNGGCCFDYGNSETTRTAAGAGAMDAIYFGTSCWFQSSAYKCSVSGTGPWVEMDPEYGIFASNSSTSWNSKEVSLPFTYVTAMLKNNGTTNFALKGGNAQTGALTTMWDGALPNGYNPMKKQGAIVLGSGGDCCRTGNGNQSEGTFYEGAIVAGYPTDATDNAIQANIAAAGYGSATVAVQPTDSRRAPAVSKGLFLSLGSGMNMGALPRDGRSMRIAAHNLSGKRVAEGYLSAEGQPVWTSGSLPTGAYFVKAVPAGNAN
ncbi:MAG: xylan 1,4-beta-xylosidase [Fibrobacteres bacterium]|nr:xylan 1,4-beta-xylosidase [Fibrobacterota bacterium]